MNVLDVKEIFKTLLKASFSKISGMEFDAQSPLSLVIHLSHEETEQDYEFLTNIPEAKFQVKKSKKRGKTLYQGASAEKISRAVKCVSAQDFKNANHCPPSQIKSMPSISFNSQDNPPACFFQHSPIYVAGRYCKLKRHISNSAWVINGKRMTEDSMEELIGNFLPLTFGNESYKFSSAGREDSDVLMLGDGRPFYFELIHPKVGLVSQESLTKLEKKINDSVDGKIKVFDLQIVTLEDTSILKNSAATKSKSYMYFIYFLLIHILGVLWNWKTQSILKR
jgi:tRNA pseudouridine synthase 10